MSSLISFDTGSESDPVYDGCTEQVSFQAAEHSFCSVLTHTFFFHSTGTVFYSTGKSLSGSSFAG